MYLSAADSPYFPQTWDICQEFMRKLGTPIKVLTVSTA